MIAQQFSTMPALRKEQVKFLAPNYLLLHGQGMLYPLVTFLYTTNTLYTYIYIQVKKNHTHKKHISKFKKSNIIFCTCKAK